MSAITTHVLDLELGRPAAGIAVRLEVFVPDRDVWVELSRRTTDADGRVKDLLEPGAPLDQGSHRITFATGAYFAARGAKTFYPSVSIEFAVSEPTQHHHVPLLLSPFGYSTYRGS
jgi:5-hydroxyisourate hydrolase